MRIRVNVGISRWTMMVLAGCWMGLVGCNHVQQQTSLHPQSSDEEFERVSTSANSNVHTKDVTSWSLQTRPSSFESALPPPPSSSSSPLLLSNRKKRRRSERLKTRRLQEKVKVTPHIYNGRNAPPHKYTYFAQTWGSANGCGASLIASKWILTAAHCIHDSLQRMEMDNFPSWQVGYYCRNESDNCRVPFSIVPSKRGYLHPRYNTTALAWDYGLVELTHAVPEFVSPPVPIDDGFVTDNLVEGQSVRGIGSGIINNNGDSPFYLQEIDNAFLPLAECRIRFFTLLSRFDESILCTDGGPNQAFCFGDSGSPILVADATSWSGYRQVGIHSFGPAQCQDHIFPDGAARISSAYDWIRSIVCPSYDASPQRAPHFCANDNNRRGNGEGAATLTATEPPSPMPTLSPFATAPSPPPSSVPVQTFPTDQQQGTETDDKDICKEKSKADFWDFRKRKFRTCHQLRREKNRKKYCTARTTALTDCPKSCRVCHDPEEKNKQ